MTKVSENRLLEFCANAGYNESFRLYVREGKPVRIERKVAKCSTTIFTNDWMFDSEFKAITSLLANHENPEPLKNLYDSLEEGKWKIIVKGRIDKLINDYEKGLAILKP